jgi:hypothetical protein
MHGTLRTSIESFLALFLAFTPVAQALQSNSVTGAPVPPQITSGHSIFISNGGGSNYFNAFTGGPNRGYSQLYADLRQWGRYQIADSPSRADLIFEIRSVAPAIDVSGPHGTGSVVYNPQLILRILDPKTNAVLWTTTANVRAAGGQASRDKGFDESVAVLVDRVRQLTGEQLDAAQAKAIHTNSTMPRSEKILIASAIGVGVGFATFVIYKVATRKTPTLPTQALCPDPPFCPATTQ